MSSLKEPPWKIMRYIFYLERWVSEIIVQEVDFSLSPFMVQINGVPSESFSRKNAAKIE